MHPPFLSSSPLPQETFSCPRATCLGLRAQLAYLLVFLIQVLQKGVQLILINVTTPVLGGGGRGSTEL